VRPGRAADEPSADATASVGRELLKLDPWSFWVVRLADEPGASFAVLGTTGAFVVAASGLEGYLTVDGRRATVDGVRLSGSRTVKRAAKRLRGRLVAAGAKVTDVTPVVVLARAVAGGPRDHGGVRLLRLTDVVPDITGRPRVLDPSTAERLAGRLGPVVRGPNDSPPN